MRMTIKERIAGMKEKLQAMKQQRGILTKVQVFQFQPFSNRQKQILTWWMPDSPVKDYDGIIADGAIRSGKTVSMSLSFVMWAMARYDGQNFIMAGKTISSFKRNAGSQPEWKNKLFFHLWRQGRRLPRPGTGYYGSRRLF